MNDDEIIIIIIIIIIIMIMIMIMIIIIKIIINCHQIFVNLLYKNRFSKFKISTCTDAEPEENLL